MKSESKTIAQIKKRGILSKIFGTADESKKVFASSSEPIKRFELPVLPYEYDALEPHIDKRTMELHHHKHHSGYVNNLNKAIQDMENIPSIEELMRHISRYTDAIRNNGGGHYNHSMFWKIMKPNGGGRPNGRLLETINTTFGSFDNFKVKYSESAEKIFGSGWVWLVVRNEKLEIGTTPNQDNPLMDVSDFKGKPLLALDVWEHAYYLKYQNKRNEYVANWWNTVNWDEVAKRLG